MNVTTTFCFLDTNTLIHFTTFDEVDWLTVLACKQVCLVIAPVVLRELDTLKEDNRNPWRQNRARMLLSRFRSILSNVPEESQLVRPGVSLIDIVKEPQVDWATLGLDRDINDDRLLATIIEFASANNVANLLVLTNDFPLQRKAIIRQVRPVDPEGMLKRLESNSSEERRIRDLERQIQRLESTIPALELNFWEKGETVATVTRAIVAQKMWPNDPEIYSEILQKENGVGHYIPQAWQQRVTQIELEKFRSEHQTYRGELLMARRMERSRDFGYRCVLDFVLRNTGSVPAEDVEIAVNFPPESFVVDVPDEEMKYFGTVVIPKEPIPRWIKQNQSPFELTNVMTNISARPQEPPQPKPRGPLYELQGDRSVVFYRHPKFRHQDSWHMNSVVAYISPKISGGFEIRYSIRADNVKTPVEGHLNVVLESDSQNSANG